jgi:hypothetical protein
MERGNLMDMKPSNELKMYTLRHFLFYMGVAAVLGVVVSAAGEVLGWSNGLTFGALLTAGLVVSTAAMREGLFGPAQRVDERRDVHHRI